MHCFSQRRCSATDCARLLNPGSVPGQASRGHVLASGCPAPHFPGAAHTQSCAGCITCWRQQQVCSQNCLYLFRFLSELCTIVVRSLVASVHATYTYSNQLSCLQVRCTVGSGQIEPLKTRGSPKSTCVSVMQTSALAFHNSSRCPTKINGCV